MNEDYWDKNGLVKPAERIVCAANKYGNLILCGARHWDKIMHAQADAIPGFSDLRKQHGEEQGFINQFGEFRSRKQALEIVKANGQHFDHKRNGASDELYSEGLY